MIVLQSNVVADIARTEDKLYLIPGNAVGTATPEGIPVCYRSPSADVPPASGRSDMITRSWVFLSPTRAAACSY